MFTAPTAIRAIKKEDPDGRLLAKYDMSHFRAQFLAGERCDPDTLKWCKDKLKVPAVDPWWQTENGWPIASNCLGTEENGTATCRARVGQYVSMSVVVAALTKNH